MNNVILSGQLTDIEESHVIADTKFYKANIIVPNSNGYESILPLKFKQFSNTYKDGDIVTLSGNIRSYSTRLSETKNKVELYCFTYFDKPDGIDANIKNHFIIDGSICKKDDLVTLDSGKEIIHFIVKNTIQSGFSKLNSYLPCVAWGKVSKFIDNLSLHDNLIISGEFRSREYKKYTDSDKNDFEIKVAHELLVTNVGVNDAWLF